MITKRLLFAGIWIWVAVKLLTFHPTAVHPTLAFTSAQVTGPVSSPQPWARQRVEATRRPIARVTLPASDSEDAVALTTDSDARMRYRLGDGDTADRHLCPISNVQGARSSLHAPASPPRPRSQA